MTLLLMLAPPRMSHRAVRPLQVPLKGLPMQALTNRRRSIRSSVLKRAQIVTGEAVFDCVVIDSSADGARVGLASPTVLPATVQLRFVGGVAARADQRWGCGVEVGFELREDQRQLSRMQSEEAWVAYEALRDGHMDRAVRMLGRANFFDDEALRAAAEAAAAARDKLEAALRMRAQSEQPSSRA